MGVVPAGGGGGGGGGGGVGSGSGSGVLCSNISASRCVFQVVGQKYSFVASFNIVTPRKLSKWSVVHQRYTKT